MGCDEFTVHLISTASMYYFQDNTLASFGSFCSEEIALDGDWRVALSERIFPTKLNNVTDEELTYFRASEVVASKSNAGIGIQFPDLTTAKKFLSNQQSTLL